MCFSQAKSCARNAQRVDSAAAADCCPRGAKLAAAAVAARAGGDTGDGTAGAVAAKAAGNCRKAVAGASSARRWFSATQISAVEPPKRWLAHGGGGADWPEGPVRLDGDGDFDNAAPFADVPREAKGKPDGRGTPHR